MPDAKMVVVPLFSGGSGGVPPDRDQLRATVAAARARKVELAPPLAFDWRRGRMVLGEVIPEEQRFMIRLWDTFHGWTRNGEGRLIRWLEERRVENPDPEAEVPWVETVRLHLVGIGGGLAGREFQWDAAGDQLHWIAGQVLSDACAFVSTPMGERGFFNPVVELRRRDPEEHAHYTYVAGYPVADLQLKIVGWSDGQTVNARVAEVQEQLWQAKRVVDELKGDLNAYGALPDEETRS